jgi:alpha-methylacyl-CoA racemase
LFAIVHTLAALVERSRTGVGSLIDVAMIDGVSTLLTPIRDLADLGAWVEKRSSNLLDGGAPFYRTYRTSDGRFMAVGALEPAFYSAFVEGLGLLEADLPNRSDTANWDTLAETFTDVFSRDTQEHWHSTFDGSDACVTPVLTMSEAAVHPQNQPRKREGSPQPAASDGARAALSDAGLSTEQVDALVLAEVIQLR